MNSFSTRLAKIAILILSTVFFDKLAASFNIPTINAADDESPAPIGKVLVIAISAPPFRKPALFA